MSSIDWDCDHRSYVVEPPICGTPGNLSVPGRRLIDMNTSNGPIELAEDVFGDPVAYLAAFGIDAELVADTSLPAAA